MKQDNSFSNHCDEKFTLHVSSKNVQKKGPIGRMGQRGPKGKRGRRGPAGPMGPPGPPGPQGGFGPKGCMGRRGPKGPPGDIGPKGPEGPVGPVGLRGTRGPRNGPPGCPGEDGPPGPRGPQGDGGVRGPQGDGGPQGEDGQDGLQGKRGPCGEDGDAGEPGPIGCPGNVGDVGEDGLTGNIANNFTFYVLKLNKVSDQPLSNVPQPIESVGSSAIFYDSTNDSLDVEFFVSQPAATQIQVDVVASEDLDRAFAVIPSYTVAVQSAQGDVETGINSQTVSLTVENILLSTPKEGLIIQVYLRWVDVG